MERIAIFASGTGSNARKIIKHFQSVEGVDVALLCSNRSNAGALEHARKRNIPTEVLDKQQINDGDALKELMEQYEISFIALAGYLKRIPPELIRAYPLRILNLHPALLPEFGGKGMYGDHVHQAVLDAEKGESGISIHLVNEKYDEGEIIFQATCPVQADDDPDSLSQRIHKLEHEHYPKVIHRWLNHLKSRNL